MTPPARRSASTLCARQRHAAHLQEHGGERRRRRGEIGRHRPRHAGGSAAHTARVENAPATWQCRDPPVLRALSDHRRIQLSSRAAYLCHSRLSARTANSCTRHRRLPPVTRAPPEAHRASQHAPVHYLRWRRAAPHPAAVAAHTTPRRQHNFRGRIDVRRPAACHSEVHSRQTNKGGARKYTTLLLRAARAHAATDPLRTTSCRRHRPTRAVGLSHPPGPCAAVRTLAHDRQVFPTSRGRTSTPGTAAGRRGAPG